MSVLHLTKENFETEVMKSEKPVLIDFWAGWCGPCKMLGPVIDEVAEEITDAKICKVNVDEEPDLAAKFQVMSIPTLIVVKDGEVAQMSVGYKPKAEVIKMLK